MIVRHCEEHSDVATQILPWGILVGVRPTKIVMKLLEEGKSEEEIRAYMADTYEVSPPKIELALNIAKHEQKILGQEGLDVKDGYSLYVGIPFCPSKCLYCSFTSYPIDKWEPRVEEYLDALEKELEFTAKLCGDRSLNTIYIGGGTPTTLSPKQLNRLFTTIGRLFDFSHLLEYTVEAGRPDSIDREKLQVLKDHGITRISVNPQTMQQKTLDAIGRKHSVEQSRECFLLAREMGFDNINMDLIVGLPGEGIADIQDTLEQIKELEPDSLTVHGLTVKRGSRLFERMTEENTGLPRYAAENRPSPWQTCGPEMVDSIMGLNPYYLYRQKNADEPQSSERPKMGSFENVGYAKPGKESLYNILIMEEKQTILAVGAGAVSKFVIYKEEGPENRPSPWRACGSEMVDSVMVGLSSSKTKIHRIENVKSLEHYIARIDEMLDRKKKGIDLWR